MQSKYQFSYQATEYDILHQCRDMYYSINKRLKQKVEELVVQRVAPAQSFAIVLTVCYILNAFLMNILYCTY